ncbi:uncharacterized protein LOC117103697 [Anneissia japonica]|uniref:uncharacterized protein LOC117103697 n=1 Tax=Anneissia japonica TaxID=1529436 RepID=UPI0014256255|nr:uncharacterized protein LOC117103697 [Anneissia japonica]
MGKAKVTPLKKVSIPRLELLAAVLAVKLDSIVRRETTPRFKIAETTFWSDSMIVLGYITNETKRFKTFVANRVTKIREASKPHQWRHVRSEDNPADEGSRGTLQMRKWVTGPGFLLDSEERWPRNPILDMNLAGDPEVKLSVFTHTTKEKPKNDVLEALSSKISTWTRLLRVYAWVLRFAKNLLSEARRVKSSSLSVSGIRASESKILNWLQRTELSNWKTNKSLTKLSPVLMTDLLRVGGRVNQAQVSEEKKHPVILPARTNITKLIIRHHHEAVGHSGWASTLNSIRERRWLINGRSAVRSATRNSVVCKKYQAKPVQQIMADLPADRITDNKPPFTFVGIDYFGPIDVKQGRSRVKRYGCIFTCLVSRAVHLELAKGLDADSFINALRRFLARRGQPERIYSDNGTNFHGGERDLAEAIKSFNNNQIETFCHTKMFEWHFNPPNASHFGGAWERLIKSVRRILYGVLRQQTVCEDVLSTVLTEVESILNSRPLTSISQDIRDEQPLTPTHLLLLRQGPDAPLGNRVDKSASYGKKRWLQVRYLASLFWTCWRKEYLPLLQQRNKWTTPKENVRKEDLVLLVDETTPKGRWPMGKVVQVYKSKDGRVRSVDVKVNNSVLKRQVVKICIVYRSSIANL